MAQACPTLASLCLAPLPVFAHLCSPNSWQLRTKCPPWLPSSWSSHCQYLQAPLNPCPLPPGAPSAPWTPPAAPWSFELPNAPAALSVPVAPLAMKLPKGCTSAPLSP